MIDDTGPRITALERRVAEIEARLLGMERVDAAIANNVLALEREAARFADRLIVEIDEWVNEQARKRVQEAP